MPKLRRILRVLVASPSDVSPEKEKLEEVINEVNQILGLQHGIHFEPIKWETHTRPAVGTDAQAVINKQLGDDYDIFLGILWTRFGTPTPRALSGTQEEFERAYERYKSDPTSIDIMFYFKEAPPTSLNEIDTRQLDLVREFRKQFENKGLYRTFNSIEQFEKLTRMHLINLAMEWENKIKEKAGNYGAEEATTKKATPEEEKEQQESKEKQTDLEGLLELVERWEERTSTTTEFAKSVMKDIEDFSSNVRKRTAELAALQIPKDNNTIKQIINSIAQQMEFTAIKVESSRPIFKEAFNDAMSSIERIAIIAPGLGISTTGGGIARLPSQIHSLQTALLDLNSNLAKMCKLIETLPRMTTKLNHARRKLADSLKKLEQEIDYALSLTLETENTIRKIIK